MIGCLNAGTAPTPPHGRHLSDPPLSSPYALDKALHRPDHPSTGLARPAKGCGPVPGVCTSPRVNSRNHEITAPCEPLWAGHRDWRLADASTPRLGAPERNLFGARSTGPREELEWARTEDKSGRKCTRTFEGGSDCARERREFDDDSPTPRREDVGGAFGAPKGIDPAPPIGLSDTSGGDPADGPPPRSSVALVRNGMVGAPVGAEDDGGASASPLRLESPGIVGGSGYY
jgi:hypothetical protein